MAKVKHYITADGYDPFDAYLRSVKDPIAKAMIATRVARMLRVTMVIASHAERAFQNSGLTRGQVTASISAKS